MRTKPVSDCNLFDVRSTQKWASYQFVQAGLTTEAASTVASAA